MIFGLINHCKRLNRHLSSYWHYLIFCNPRTKTAKINVVWQNFIKVGQLTATPFLTIRRRRNGSASKYSLESRGWEAWKVNCISPGCLKLDMVVTWRNTYHRCSQRWHHFILLSDFKSSRSGSICQAKEAEAFPSFSIFGSSCISQNCVIKPRRAMEFQL